MERARQIAGHFATGQRGQQNKIPKNVLIVGSGVFGLGTAYALAQRDGFKDTQITVLEKTEFPAQDASSVDSSRIIRADYDDLVYAQLMQEAMPHWLGEFGEEARFSQSGLAIFSNRVAAEADSFLQAAFENVTQKLGLQVGKDITIFNNDTDARKVMGTTGGFIGSRGYVNWTSGWAHAENGLKFLRRKVEALNRVHFVTAEVQRLLFDHSYTSVLGVQLPNNRTLTADLTILATGAWTPKLLDTRGICSATGQILTFIDITSEEQARLTQPGQPVLIRESDGLFIIPPVENKLKIARHGYGYANPVTIPHPERPLSSGEKITVSLPRTKLDDPDMDIPPEAKRVCRDFLREAIPSLADRPFSYTRVCWYTDTPTGDWLITYHPQYSGLFVATGGSGHGYKFLPTIGERIVDVLTGTKRDELGAELEKRWRWPAQRQEEDHVWTRDWRGEGKKGLILEEEMGNGGEV